MVDQAPPLMFRRNVTLDKRPTLAPLDRYVYRYDSVYVVPLTVCVRCTSAILPSVVRDVTCVTLPAASVYDWKLPRCQSGRLVEKSQNRILLPAVSVKVNWPELLVRVF